MSVILSLNSKGFRVFSFLSLMLFLLPASYLFAQKSIDEQVEKGLNYCYDFQWSKAENVFQTLIEKYPENPVGYHYISSIYFWYYLSNKQQQYYDTFISNSDKTIETAKNLLDINRDEKILYILGSNYSYRSIVFAKAEDFLDAAWATKESESYLKESIEIDPKLYDAFLGLGLYNFAIAQIPAAFKWVLSLAGISGNQAIGLNYIKTTAEKGNYSKIEARYYLSQIYSEVLYDYKNASVILNSLVKTYPHNTLFIYSLAVLEMKKRNMDKAQTYLEKILNEKNINFKQLISFSNFLMGDVCFRKNNFEEAARFYTNFLTSAPTKDYTGIAAFRLALCCELTGNRAKAVEYFAASDKGNKDLDDDIYAKRKGVIYQNRPVSKNEIELIKVSNLVENGKYKEAVDTLNNLVPIFKKEKQIAEAKLLLTDAYYFMENYDASLKTGKEALTFDGKEDNWIKPFAMYYLARTHLKKGEVAEAKYYIEEADDFSNYDYQNKLKNLLDSLIKEK